jgi:hypothetical protein
VRPLGYRTDTIGDIEEFTQDDALPLPFFLNAEYDMNRLGSAQIPTILLQGALLCCVGSIESLMTAQVVSDFTKTTHSPGMVVGAMGMGNVISGFLGGMGGNTARSKCPLGSAPARLLRLLRARLAALGSSALPGVEGPAHWAPSPLPRLLERAASNAADSPAFGHPGNAMIGLSTIACLNGGRERIAPVVTAIGVFLTMAVFHQVLPRTRTPNP